MKFDTVQKFYLKWGKFSAYNNIVDLIEMSSGLLYTYLQ